MTVKYNNGLLTFSFPPLSLKLLKILIPTSLIITTSYYLFSPGARDSALSEQANHLYNAVVSGEKGHFIMKALETEIDGPFNGTATAELCSSRDWVPGLIFKCNAPQGGVGNVRNVFLNCIRYAIEAGGMFPLTISPVPRSCN
jgi:hypothetical protein